MKAYWTTMYNMTLYPGHSQCVRMGPNSIHPSSAIQKWDQKVKHPLSAWTYKANGQDMGIFSLLYETESKEAGLNKEWAQRHRERLEELDDFYFMKAPCVSIKLPKISALFLPKPAYNWVQIQVEGLCQGE